MDVTVVLPVHNRAQSLQRALDSLSAQTVRPAEVIVVDDASTDGSADVARAWGATVLVNEHNQGAGQSRNRAIRAATSPWIAFIDSDDEWYPHHLETVTAAAPGRVLVTAVADDTNGQPRGNATGRELDLSPVRCLVPDNPVVTSATLVHRSTAIEVGLFPSMARVEDLDLWIRVLERGAGVALAAHTVSYAVRPSDEAGVVDARDRPYLREVVERYRDRPWMTSSLHSGVLGRIRWDDLRWSLRQQRRGEALRHAGWLALHPRAAWSVLQTLLTRRAARRLAVGGAPAVEGGGRGV